MELPTCNLVILCLILSSLGPVRKKVMLIASPIYGCRMLPNEALKWCVCVVAVHSHLCLHPSPCLCLHPSPAVSAFSIYLCLTYHSDFLNRALNKVLGLEGSVASYFSLLVLWVCIFTTLLYSTSLDLIHLHVMLRSFTLISIFNMHIPVITGIQCMWGWGSELTVPTVAIARDFWPTTVHCIV